MSRRGGAYSRLLTQGAKNWEDLLGGRRFPSQRNYSASPGETFGNPSAMMEQLRYKPTRLDTPRPRIKRRAA